MEKELAIFYEKNVKNMIWINTVVHLKVFKVGFSFELSYSIARVSNLQMNQYAIIVQTNEADYVIRRTLRSSNVIP